MILIDDVMPQRVQSTAAFVEALSELVPGGISYSVEQLVLRYLVDTRSCPLCTAEPGFQCHTVGSQNLRRTHLERLKTVSDSEIKVTVEWALLEHERQRREDD